MADFTDKQRLFVVEYTKDLNATRAAIRAGYSKRSARNQGQRMMTNDDVRAAIDAALEERIERTKMDADEVLLELSKIARSDMRDYAEWGPGGVRLKESEGLTDEAAAAVAEVSQTVTAEGGSTRFKLHDKKGALELLGKHLKLFTEKHEHSGPGGGPIRTIEVIGVDGDEDEDGGEFEDS
jgi:phage terminase small subunit